MRRLFNRNLNTVDLPKIRRINQQNRPINSPWLQQKLNSYRPLLTLKYGLIIVTFVEIILILAGAFLYNAANQAKEGIIDYTYCTKTNEPIHMPHKYTDNSTSKDFFVELRDNSYYPELYDDINDNKTCLYTIEIRKDYIGDVKFYYSLENYYQNMRLYVRSRNDDQLQGKNLDEIDDCHPYTTVTNKNGQKIPIAPCGAVANSLFNDTYMLYYQQNNTLTPVPWTTKGLLDKKMYKKYSNPQYPVNQTLCDAFINTTKPPNWHVPTCQLTDNDGGYGFESFDFMIWMQTAALPKFRKLYRGLNKTSIFKSGLPKGTYVLKIIDNYPVNDYNGKKRFIIGLGGLFGQKSYFLPITYFIMAIGLFFATMFLIIIQCCKCTYLENRIGQVVRHF